MGNMYKLIRTMILNLYSGTMSHWYWPQLYNLADRVAG